MKKDGLMAKVRILVRWKRTAFFIPFPNLKYKWDRDPSPGWGKVATLWRGRMGASLEKFVNTGKYFLK